MAVEEEALPEEEESQQHHRTLVLFTPRTTQGGRHPGTLIYPHSTRVKNTGPGASPATNVMSLRSALGNSSSPLKPTMAETVTSLQTLTTKFTIFYMTRRKKYIQSLLQTRSKSLLLSKQVESIQKIHGRSG